MSYNWAPVRYFVEACSIFYILQLFHLKGFTRMCTIVMCADHNGLCIGLVSNVMQMYLDIWFLVFIVSGPYFEIFFGFGPMLG